MLSQLLLPHLKRNLFVGNFHHCLYYVWDFRLQRLFPCNKFDLRWTRSLIFIYLFYLIVQIVGIRHSSAALAEKIQVGILTSVYTSCLVVGIEWKADPANIQLLNMIHQKGQNRIDGEKNNKFWSVN